MKKCVLLILMLVAGLTARAQVYAFHGQVIARGAGVTAQVVPFANVLVCQTGTSCSYVAVYSDKAETQPISQPPGVVADASGNYQFFTATPCVDLHVSAPNQGSLVVSTVCSNPTTGLGTVTNVSAVSANGFTLSVTNPGTTPSISLAADVSHYLPTTADQSSWNTAAANASGLAAVAHSGKYTDLAALPDVDVRTYGAVADGATDDTAAIAAAVSSFGSNGGTLLFPAGTYKTTSTLTLPSNVNLVALDSGFGDSNGHTIISANFAGFVFKITGVGNKIAGITVKNAFWNGTLNTAGAVEASGVTGAVIIRDAYLQANDTPLYAPAGSEMDSWSIEDSYLVGDNGSNGLSRCISAFGRNSHFRGGRAYGCHVAYDLAGDDWLLDAVNAEFDDIDIRTQANSGMLVQNSHFETSGMLWTNATTLPTTTTYPWTDNGGNGSGWSGTIRFVNNSVFFSAHGSASPQGAPLIVLKSQPSMVGRFVLDGNNFQISATSISPNFYSVSSSFDYTVSPALVAGVSVVSWDTINIPTIPPTYSYWMDLSGSANGIRLLGSPNSVSFGALSSSTATIGTGTSLSKVGRYTASLTPTSVAANSCAQQNGFTVTGIALGDNIASVVKATNQAGLFVSSAIPTAANTVAIYFCNLTASAITPTASETYSFAVLQ